MAKSLLFILIVACFLSGCGIHGNKIDPNVANNIKNGDTRESVEQKLGEPDFVDPPKNGVCHVAYKYDENHGDALSYVPYVNLFAGGQKIRSQFLTIVYKDGIVQEHEFTDDTQTMSGGIVNMTVRRKPTNYTYTPSTQPK